MPEPSRVTAVMAIGVYNVVQNLLVPAPAYVPANLAATAGLVAMARAQGCTWDDLGLDPSRAGTGLWLGMTGAGLATVAALAARAHPATRRYLLDQRVADQRNSDVAYRVVVRFPLGTALFEEVAFRGVVSAVWQRSGASKSQAAVAAATTFGLWHIIPGNDALTGNPLASRFGSLRARVAVVIVGTIATGLAGLGFTWMRERSGSLAAPWMTHAAINGAVFLAGVAHWRRVARDSPAGVGMVGDKSGAHDE